MAKSQKVSGYLVKIEAFVPADLFDISALKIVQENADHAVKTFGPLATVKLAINHTRR